VTRRTQSGPRRLGHGEDEPICLESDTVSTVIQNWLPDLSLNDWAVLALVAEQPMHGFAIARELAPGGILDRYGLSGDRSSIAL
jgi:hypothetical protein